MKEIWSTLERYGVPGRDLHDLPSSDARFPDGAHCRIEIAGIERAAALEEMLDGADTFNPLADLTLPMLASIRRSVQIPMDVYVSIVDAMGGINRFWEAAEIARVCAPCYFKFEPGASEDTVYKPWVSPEFHNFFSREKVRLASIACELIGRCNPEIVISGKAPSSITTASLERSSAPPG